jgi:branched-chain amino acid transport system substrate-binding protein
VLYDDDRSTMQGAFDGVRKLAGDHGVVALLGEVVSSRSLAGARASDMLHIPMLAPMATAPEVTKERDWVFRAIVTDVQQGQAAARYARELSMTKVGILFGAQDSYSFVLAASFRDEITKLGGKVVADEGFRRGETNFSVHLAALNAAKPDVVFVPVYYSDMILIARQAKAMGIAGSSFVGGDGWDSAELLAGAGGALDGARFLSHWVVDGPFDANKRFVSAFRTKYEREPSSVSASAYDAAGLLFDAMRRATEISREGIRKALAETRRFAGVSGLVAMGKDHNPMKSVLLVGIANGRFHYAGRIPPM